MARYQQQYQALGSAVLITLVTEKGETDSERLFSKVRQQITGFEQQFSRFLPGSELTRFNHRAGVKTPVSPSFLKLLTVAEQLAIETNDLYNPFILPNLQRAGYLGSWPNPENGITNTDFTRRRLTSIGGLTIGDSWAKIPKSAALDFGGLGKGYLLDELAKTLASEHLSGFWLSIGGDIICQGCDVNGETWQIAVPSALDRLKTIDVISNQPGARLAIATSGVTKRQGIKDGKAWHHIIDPRTGKPAQTDILTATVTAQRAVVADVYAKCLVIAGVNAAEPLKATGRIQSYLLQVNNYDAGVTEAAKV